MAGKTYELQGYTIALQHIVFITQVFEAEAGEGYQFNIRFSADVRLGPKFPTRNEAELARGLLAQALSER
ncbi:MAG: hypothetical protein HRU51_08705 [Xanthomonadales bacterium]|nr:hypothetical protein [Xanthomonadales bacterium]